MDKEKPGASRESTEEMDVEKDLTNKFLSGEMSFAEYSSEWCDGEDEEDSEEFKRNDEDVAQSVQLIEKSNFRRRRRTRLSPALMGLMGEANLRFARGDIEMAERMCHEIIKQLPTAAEPYQTLAQIYEHDIEKSLQFSLLAAHLSSSDAEHWWRLAGLCKQINDVKQEMICYSQAVKSEPQNLEAHMKRLEYLTKLEENKYPVNTLNITRVKCYHKIVVSLPSSEGEIIMKYAKMAATMYHSTSETEKAVEVMAAAYKKCPSLFTLEDINILLELLILQKQYQSCIDIFVSNIGVEIEAEIQTVKNSNDEIEEHTNYLNCVIPDNMAVDLKSKLLVCFIHLGAFTLVKNLLNDFLSSDVEKAGDLYMDIEEAFSSVGHYEMAIKLLEPLVTNTNFDLGAVWLKYAECLQKLGREDDAIQAYYKVLKHVPQHPDACRKLFTILKMRGDIGEALKILQQDYKYVVSASLLYEQCQILKNQNNLLKYLEDVAFFPILRLLLPQCERERNPYNLKEKKLGSLLVKVLSLNPKSIDAQKLINFSSVHSSTQESDFAWVAYFVLKNRFVQMSSILSIADINEMLDNIAKADVENKGILLDEVFSYAIRKLTAQEFKWFLRIILKNLKLEMSENRILGTFHPHATELYQTCSSLYEVCEKLKTSNVLSGTESSDEAVVKLFFAVKPMLSQRLDVTNIHQLPPSITNHIEDKFDGERFQMHMENGVFEYFSRNGHKYAKKYGSTYDSGTLTPDLKDCFSADVHNFIIDGEMMGWHKRDQCFGCKGMSYDIKTITENSSYRPCYCVFDIIYYNGKSLIGEPEKGGLPLKERLNILDTLFTDVPGVIQHSKRSIVKDSTDVLNALNAAIDNQDEGIVVKDVNSYYKSNKRNEGWYKIKPEYTDDTMVDLDFVVIGADEAENKRQGRAKSFHVACIDVKPDGARWVCVGRVAGGLAGAERERVCAALQPHWRASRSAPPPPCLHFNKETPDFWVLPDHSIVFQVRATELIRSSTFGAPYTLRFPRVMRVRTDKPVSDIMTLQEFNQLVSTRSPVIKLSRKRVNETQLNQMQPMTLRRRVANLPQVSERFRTKTTGDVQVVSKALLDRKLCVISDEEDCKKADLVKVIESHGGKHVENPGPDTWCCVVGRMTPLAKKRIEIQELDIVTASWLRSLPPSDTLCSLTPLNMLSMKRETRWQLSLDYDSFGDSFKDEIDENVLKKCLQNMQQSIYPTTKEKLKLDEQLFGDNNPFSFLRSCTIHIAKNPLHRLLAKMYGASVSDDFASLTHIVIPRDTSSEDVQNFKNDVNVKIVSDEWLEACFQAKRLVNELDYIM
ncbi:DNA ligase 4-like isoform X2 [Vanessa atalanta]|uniref:DNA ligase 4-like isoform X2 n=1 Tax=Vanessa atalanta TaxID=42275 RepID=UPI001FCDA5D6|nr:DNA ligase 4-like isoform X2 [Vanessa atalanta]